MLLEFLSQVWHCLGMQQITWQDPMPPSSSATVSYNFHCYLEFLNCLSKVVSSKIPPCCSGGVLVGSAGDRNWCNVHWSPCYLLSFVPELIQLFASEGSYPLKLSFSQHQCFLWLVRWGLKHVTNTDDVTVSSSLTIILLTCVWSIFFCCQ